MSSNPYDEILKGYSPMSNSVDTPKSPYDDIIQGAAEAHGLDPDLIRATMRQESTFKPNARSPKGASGLMQLMPETAKNLGVKNILDPKENIYGGAKYLKQQLDKFGGDVPKALAAYNAGPGAVVKYGGIPPYKETRDYVKRITGNYKGLGYADPYGAILKDYAPDAPQQDVPQQNVPQQGFLPPQDIPQQPAPVAPVMTPPQAVLPPETTQIEGMAPIEAPSAYPTGQVAPQSVAPQPVAQPVQNVAPQGTQATAPPQKVNKPLHFQTDEGKVSDINYDPITGKPLPTQQLPNGMTRVTFESKPDNVTNKDYFINSITGDLASQLGASGDDVETVLRKTLRTIKGTPLDQITKNQYYDFQMTPEFAQDVATAKAQRIAQAKQHLEETAVTGGSLDDAEASAAKTLNPDELKQIVNDPELGQRVEEQKKKYNAVLNDLGDAPNKDVLAKMMTGYLTSNQAQQEISDRKVESMALANAEKEAGWDEKSKAEKSQEYNQWKQGVLATSGSFTNLFNAKNEIDKKYKDSPFLKLAAKAPLLFGNETVDKENKVRNEYFDYGKSRLSDAEIKSAEKFGEGMKIYLPQEPITQSIVGGAMSAGADMMQLAAGTIRTLTPMFTWAGSDDWAGWLDRASKQTMIAAEKSSPDTDTILGKIAYGGRAVGTGVGQFPGIAGTTVLAGGNPVLGFAIHAALTNTNKPTNEQTSAIISNAVLAAVFEGAPIIESGSESVLGSIAKKLGISGAEKTALESLTPTERAVQIGNAIISKSTRVGTLFGIGAGQSLASNPDDKTKAVENGLMLAVLDLGMSAFGHEPKPDEWAKLDNKILKVPDANNNPRDVMVKVEDGKPVVYDVTGNVPDGVQQAIVAPRKIKTTETTLKPIDTEKVTKPADKLSEDFASQPEKGFQITGGKSDNPAIVSPEENAAILAKKATENAPETSANSSSESTASQEAINRLESEKNAGLKRVVVDTRSKTERPLIGVDAVDYTPKPHESIEYRGGGRNGEVIAQGDKVSPAYSPPERDVVKTEAKAETKTAEPDVYEINADELAPEKSSEAPSDKRIPITNKEGKRIGFTFKPENWKEVYDSIPADDMLGRHDILRSMVNRKDASESQLSAVLDELGTEKYGNASNILRDLSSRSDVPESIQKRAQKMYEAISPSLTPEEQLKIDTTRSGQLIQNLLKENEELSKPADGKKKISAVAKQTILNNQRAIDRTLKEYPALAEKYKPSEPIKEGSTVYNASGKEGEVVGKDGDNLLVQWTKPNGEMDGEPVPVRPDKVSTAKAEKTVEPKVAEKPIEAKVAEKPIETKSTEPLAKGQKVTYLGKEWEVAADPANGKVTLKDSTGRGKLVSVDKVVPAEGLPDTQIKSILGDEPVTPKNAMAKAEEIVNAEDQRSSSQNEGNVTANESKGGSEGAIAKPNTPLTESKSDAIPKPSEPVKGESPKPVETGNAKAPVQDIKYGAKNKLYKPEDIQADRDLLLKTFGGKGGSFGSNGLQDLSPDVAKALARVAAFHIEAGARSFGDFTARMVSELGDKIKPYLDDLYRQVYDVHNNEFKGMETPEPLSPTSTKNRIVDAERAERGQEPIMSEGKRAFGDVWDKVMKDIDNDPTLPAETVQKILKGERTGLKPDEQNAILLHARITAKNAFDKANADVVKAFESNNEGDRIDARLRLASASDDLYNVDKASRLAGTEAGQGLAARKMMANEDYSLAALETGKRAAVGGRQLTEVERAHLEKIANDYKAKTDALEKTLAERDAEIKQQKEIIEQKVTRPIIARAEKIVAKLDQRAEAARVRLQQRGAMFTVGIDPLALKDLAEIGASHIGHLGLDVAKFSDAMVKEFGDKIKPHLDEIYNKAKEIFADPSLLGKDIPNERRLEIWKKGAEKRKAILENRLATGDVQSHPRKTLTQFDKEANQLKVDIEKLKRQVKRERFKDLQANRTEIEKSLDAFTRWRRFGVLSWPTTLAKLTSAAIQRLAITPAEEAVGAVYSKVFPKLASQAPREGGLNLKAEVKALVSSMTSGMRDAAKTFKEGSDLDILYGKDYGTQGWQEFPGRVHAALKAPVKRAEFERSLEKRTAFNIKNGVDVTDPLVQMDMMLGAYKDANRSIFMQDSRITQFISRGLSALEAPRKDGTVSVPGKLTATAIRTVMPIVKVPVNFVGETMQYAGGLISGSAKFGIALRKGVENLSPEEADVIMRHLKKGTVGPALLLLGYFNPQAIGGYYQPREKRKEGEPQAAGIQLFGYDLPRVLLHSPALEMLQIGATIRRVADSKAKKSDAETQGVFQGMIEGATGLAKELPFIEQFDQAQKVLTPGEREVYLKNMAKSIAVPGIIQWTAQQTDRKDGLFGDTIKRKPESLMEYIKTGIPGLRQTVPTKFGRIEGKSMSETLDTPAYKHMSTDDIVKGIKESDLKGEDMNAAIEFLKKKAYNARKSGTLTPQEVEKIKTVIPDFAITPRVRK